MITLEVDNVVYDNFDSVSVSSALDTAASSFSATLFTSFGQRIPFTTSQRCVIRSGQHLLMTGTIEQLSASYGPDDHVVDIAGRSLLGDMVDSRVGPEFALNGPVELVDAVQAMIDSVPLTLTVRSEVGNIDPIAERDKVSSSVQDSAFIVAESYCRKRQVMLTDDAAGQVVLTRGSGVATDLQLINRPGEAGNIKSATVDYDFTGRYRVYEVRSQSNLGSLPPAFSVSGGGVDIFGLATDAEVRPGRVTCAVAEKSSSSEDCANRATWQANVARARSFRYSAVVAGHAQGGVLWQKNQLVFVDDVYAGIRGVFLVNGVTYDSDRQNGNTTTLDILTPDAYRVQAELDAVTQAVTSTGVL